ncbi:hypothetical protein KW800_02675 [Candidatus Parcubacteria bacterium]|nr:hypothetical protein [Candidatus Parcubacteria bacterium]
MADRLDFVMNDRLGYGRLLTPDGKSRIVLSKCMGREMVRYLLERKEAGDAEARSTLDKIDAATNLDERIALGKSLIGVKGPMGRAEVVSGLMSLNTMDSPRLLPN